MESVNTAGSQLRAISPYIGRLEASRARELVLTLTSPGGVILDPFCGSGTVPLEAWANGRHAFGGDKNPYAIAIAKAKLYPPRDLEGALSTIELINTQVKISKKLVDLRCVPIWVRKFFHTETLREAIAWAEILKDKKEHFLFGCFLNILHHQRPGFLSFPASHVTPYLRTAKFPISEFPEMYERRDVLSRMEKKVRRTLKHAIPYDYQLQRQISLRSAERTPTKAKEIDAIITSPPYMSELDYGRDNRLRLWFCGVPDWRTINSSISPKREPFLNLMSKCVSRWEEAVIPGGHIALVLGDSKRSGITRVDVPKLVLDVFERQSKALKLIDINTSELPPLTRVIKGNTGTLFESTLIFQKRN